MEPVYNVLEESLFYGPNKLTFLAGIPVLINSKTFLTRSWDTLREVCNKSRPLKELQIAIQIYENKLETQFSRLTRTFTFHIGGI